MANNTSNRGFASSSMSEKAKQEARSKGGQNSSGNFKNDAARASREGKRGNAAEPTESKKLGGEHSHQNT